MLNRILLGIARYNPNPEIVLPKYWAKRDQIITVYEGSESSSYDCTIVFPDGDTVASNLRNLEFINQV